MLTKLSTKSQMDQDLARRAEEIVKSKTNKLTVKKRGSQRGSFVKKNKKNKVRGVASLCRGGQTRGGLQYLCTRGKESTST